MKNNEALKKHHFWILFGLVPLFVLIAVFTISSSVGGEVEKKNKEIEDAKKDLGSKSNPKSAALLGLMDDAIKKVGGKRGGLWKQNWDRQEKIYVWPRSNGFVDFVRKVKGADGKETDVPVRIEELKFGETIWNTKDQYEEFKKPEFYRSQFSTVGLTDRVPPGMQGMADTIAPTQFNGGWERILRYVNDWGQKTLVSDQIWLMMEDIWVQRSMLEAIKSVNEQIGEFSRVKYVKNGQPIDDPDPNNPTGPKDPLRRKFHSRVWDVTLEVGTRGNKQYLTGSLENNTERLQVLGIGKKTTLKVWLERNSEGGTEGIEPVEFVIDSEFLPGKGGMKKIKDRNGKEIEVPANVVTIQPDESNDKEFDKYKNIIPPGKTVSEIVKVEQVFDAQTVPVRRIEAMALNFTDSRYAAMGNLLPPPSPPFAKLDPAAASGSSGSTTPSAPPAGEGGGTSLTGPTGPPPGLTQGGGGRFGMGGATSTAIRSGGGPIASVIDANKRRYVEITPQVRRMPVGIVVIVDQAYMQDVLLAFANSSLRFQITQVTWQRFRGNLGTGSASDGTGGPGGEVMIGKTGVLGTGLTGPGGGDPDTGLGPGSMRGPRSPGGKFGSGSGPPGLGALGPMGGGGLDGMEMGRGGLTSVSEAQLTSGLVELGVYGIVSLYERYNPAADPDAAKEGEAKEPTKEPTDKEPTAPKDPKDKDQKDPMSTTPANPKKRVRRAA